MRKTHGKPLSRPFLPKEPLLRLLVINGFIGVAISLTFVACVLYFNIGNLQVLIANSDEPLLPVLMLIASLVITLGSVVMGSAVMMLGDTDDKKSGPGGGLKEKIGFFENSGDMQLRPVPVKRHR
ncbi:hypothetical protein JM93_01900 [Roseibium hamelinense]|uniref:Uncharacterized protein n=1 Tax=Roseibium hamelinense TaxID=150831 RepID=A0A562T8T7_9HYPH|nr:hypothetical protein [Roseibium hamelinense]MTI43512.1 hypothetical protein [Roseibium hamelinense]TWI89694.1 hypothetical protein JM93_01900 [Roseibium hamelinense]